jgi:hypothetical protein
MISKLLFTILLIIPLSLAQGYNEIQTRNAGIVDDLKYLGQYSGGFLFIVYTDNGRMYTIKSNQIPYFELKDSIIEYWVQCKLTGLGKRDKIFYYPIVK